MGPSGCGHRARRVLLSTWSSHGSSARTIDSLCFTDGAPPRRTFREGFFKFFESCRAPLHSAGGLRNRHSRLRVWICRSPLGLASGRPLPPMVPRGPANEGLARGRGGRGNRGPRGRSGRFSDVGSGLLRPKSGLLDPVKHLSKFGIFWISPVNSARVF